MGEQTVHRITVEAQPERADIEFLAAKLAEFNEINAGDERYRRLVIIVRDNNNQIVGGLVGSLYWNWLAVDLLWVQEGLRG